MKTNLSKSKKIILSLFSILLITSIVVSLTIYFIQRNGTRRSFIFSSAETGVFNVENRYIPTNPNKDDISYYVDEILLGPQNERSKMIFTSGTKAISCIKKGDVLYLNLSDDLLKMGINVMEINEGIDLLKTNILRNFKEISSVEIFIDGISAYENF